MTSSQVNQPVLVTSIVPAMSRLCEGQEVGRTYQEKCIASWRNAGFHIITVNTRKEANAIRESQLQVEIRTIDGDELPSVRDLVAEAAMTDTRLAGIINSDCIIIPYHGLTDRLAANVSGKLLICQRMDVDGRLLLDERIDIDSYHNIPLIGVSAGFDAFFFNPTETRTKLLPKIDRRFKIGKLYWDYWFPCLASASGLDVRRLVMPMLVHMAHEHKSRDEDFEIGRRLFYDVIVSMVRETPNDKNYEVLLKQILSGSARDISPNLSYIFDVIWRSGQNGPLRIFDGGLKTVELCFGAMQDQMRAHLTHRVNVETTQQVRENNVKAGVYRYYNDRKNESVLGWIIDRAKRNAKAFERFLRRQNRKRREQHRARRFRNSS
jgi:hypothetical protein